MLKQADIERFYADLENLDLKFPVAAIAKVTGFSKGNVSDYLGRKKEPSENFLRKFYQHFKDSIIVPSNSGAVPVDYNPITNNSQHIAARASLPPGSRQITLDDYISLLESQNEKLNKVIEANLTVLLQICSDTHETGNAILDYQKSWVEFVARKESGGVGNKKYKELKKLWDSALTSLLKGDLHKDSTAVQDS